MRVSYESCHQSHVVFEDFVWLTLVGFPLGRTI